MLTDEQLDCVRARDLDTFVALDCRGFLVGTDESAVQYAERLAGLRQRISEMQQSLDEHGSFEIEDVTLQANYQIPAKLFEEVKTQLEQLYGFAIDWVPGFYVDPSFGWLFGGCAFYWYPEFFALFIIRRSFADREKWLIYDRRELLAHELCHVARIGLRSTVFEEHFAYQTSSSAFRRRAGGVFHSQGDSFRLLGSTFLLLAAQLVRTFFLPVLPIWPFWILVFAMVTFLVVRYGRLRRTISTAVANLAAVAGDRGSQIVFRCTDEEIHRLADCSDPDKLRQWIDAQCKTGPRWQVIRARFVDR